MRKRGPGSPDWEIPAFIIGAFGAEPLAERRGQTLVSIGRLSPAVAFLSALVRLHAFEGWRSLWRRGFRPFSAFFLEGFLYAPGGLVYSLDAFDQGEADVAFASVSEAQSRGDGDLGLGDEHFREFDRP